MAATSPRLRPLSRSGTRSSSVAFSDVQNDSGLHFAAGGPGAQRELNILLGKNVRAGRLMAGVTFSAPGNWTSWPPHEHAVLAEEAYLYIDMPAPAFGVQLVYTDKNDPEVATIVREGDVVLMPAGYHPNVAAPGDRLTSSGSWPRTARTTIGCSAWSMCIPILPQQVPGSTRGRNDRAGLERYQQPKKSPRASSGR